MAINPEIINTKEPDLLHKSLVPTSETDNLLIESQIKVCDKLKTMVEFKFDGKILSLKHLDFINQVIEYDVESLEFYINENFTPFIKFKTDGKEYNYVSFYQIFTHDKIKECVPVLTKYGFSFLNNIYLPIINKETYDIEKIVVYQTKKFYWSIGEKLYENINKVHIYEDKIILNETHELEHKDNIIVPYTHLLNFGFNGIIQGFIYDKYLFKFNEMEIENMLNGIKTEPTGSLTVYKVKIKFYDTQYIHKCSYHREMMKKYQNIEITKEMWLHFFKNIPEKSLEYYDKSIMIEEEQKKE